MRVASADLSIVSVCLICVSPLPFHKRVGAAKLHSSTSLNEIDRWGDVVLHSVFYPGWHWDPPPISLFSPVRFCSLQLSQAADSIESSPCLGSQLVLWFCQYSRLPSFIAGKRHEADWSTECKTAEGTGDWIRTEKDKWEENRLRLSSFKKICNIWVRLGGDKGFCSKMYWREMWIEE